MTKIYNTMKKIASLFPQILQKYQGKRIYHVKSGVQFSRKKALLVEQQK